MTTRDSQAYQDAEYLQTDREVRLFVTLKIVSMARESVAWHIVKTLEDPVYWRAEKIDSHAFSHSIGLSCPGWRRVVTWIPGQDGRMQLTICDYSANGTMTLYSAKKGTWGRLQICNNFSDSEVVFQKTRDGSTERCEVSRVGVDDFWCLPPDIYGDEAESRAAEALILERAAGSGLDSTTELDRWARQVRRL